MTAKGSHSTHDAAADVREQLEGLPDDEARAAFLAGGITFLEGQLNVLEEQVDRVADKAAGVAETWRLKTVEAIRQRDQVADQLDAARREHDDLTGGILT